MADRDRIREKTLEILKRHKCSRDTYAGIPAERIEEDLGYVYRDGIPGFTLREIAEDIYMYSNSEEP